MTTIRFLFDYVSPYAYLASTQIEALAARHSARVEWVPVLFAPMLDASGAKGPGELPLRREYMLKDLARLARFHGVPFDLPPTHPFNPLLALRATYCVEERSKLATALFRAAWVEGRQLEDADVVGDVAERAGFPGLIEKASEAEAKTRLRAATDDAVSKGIFGVPTMLVGDEVFWGVDSLHLLERFLDGDRVDDAALARWRRVQPSARRKGAKNA